MSVTIVKGEDKTLIVRLQDGTTGDPFDLTQAYLINVALENTDQSDLDKWWVSILGDTVNGSALIQNINITTDLLEGQPLTGPGIPVGTKILKTPTSTTSPTAAGSILISQNATATATQANLIMGDIVIVSPPVIGKMKVPLFKAETLLLESGPTESFEVIATVNGVTSIIQFPSTLNVVERLISED